ncbi:MAG: hypothetical protein HC911_16365 [Chloroflexaceae bacterium]|nr:hypothetical protein [Chloroflexaceae bacterium]
MDLLLTDYMDADVAYLMGLIIARGTLHEAHGIRQVTIAFPFSTLHVKGLSDSYDQEVSIRLGLGDIRERLLELLQTDIQIIRHTTQIDLVIRFTRNTIAWRDILLLTHPATNFTTFRIPTIFFEPTIPYQWKAEFLRGYADVAGNVRIANRYVDGRHRVRLDVLNYPTNWDMPVQLCMLLQEHLAVPVQLITWGHPNMGRGFREHQINIFADAFVPIGFSLEHKQQLLTELATFNTLHYPKAIAEPCPGERRIGRHKSPDAREHDAHLAPSLHGNHYDAYWQICRALGCPRRPDRATQLLMPIDEGDPDEMSS